MPQLQCLIVALLVLNVVSQQPGHQKDNKHPPISYSECTAPGSCTSSTGGIVLDANWMWTHTTDGYKNCFTGNTWDSTECPDDDTCAKNCALDGGDYPTTYGVTSSGNEMSIKLVTTTSTGTNVGARTYLMEDDSTYKMFKLLNKEFAFDVDVSKLPCGVNGALYFVEMDADGGMAKYPGNKAGAKYGTGYCDAQCPQDLKFINGAANV